MRRKVYQLTSVETVTTERHLKGFFKHLSFFEEAMPLRNDIRILSHVSFIKHDLFSSFGNSLRIVPEYSLKALLPPVVYLSFKIENDLCFEGLFHINFSAKYIHTSQTFFTR